MTVTVACVLWILLLGLFTIWSIILDEVSSKIHVYLFNLGEFYLHLRSHKLFHECCKQIFCQWRQGSSHCNVVRMTDTIGGEIGTTLFALLTHNISTRFFLIF